MSVDNSKFYTNLDIDKSATPNDIKRAYKKLAFLHHPDRNKTNKSAAEEKFKSITNAYEILSDPNKKRVYDQFGENGLLSNNSTHNTTNPFQDMFNSFRRKQHSQTNKPTKGPGKTVCIDLSLENMMKGTKRLVKYTRRKMCSSCNGIGTHDIKNILKCIQCNGYGSINKTIQIGPNMYTTSTLQCNTCKQTGKYIRKNCQCLKCNGSKTSTETELLEIEIVIPPGTCDKNTIVLTGKSDEIPGMVTGDLVTTFRHKRDTYMYRDNNDLVYEPEISLVDALVGFDLFVPYPSGDLHIKHNDIIHPNCIKTIKGLGFPIIKKPGERGNLIIKFKIVFPKHITSKTKRKIVKLLRNEYTHVSDKITHNPTTYDITDLSSIYDETSDSKNQHNPTETKPSETKPSETKPSETKPSETKPSEHSSHIE
jgi:DnaJ family protein A protein 2